MDKYELINKIKQLDSLTDDEKSALLGLLRSHKKYGLVWEDKPEAVEDELKNKLPVLTEVKDKAIVNDTDSEHYPNHILIEGDNLHALTVLSYTHSNSIDVIYIDPPYNTGNKDFIYNDKFVDNEDSYRHSKWLSFMSRRLKIAKNLLSDKGVIFISIDDNEQAQLKLLCDKIFNQDNFIDIFSWVKTETPANLSLKTKKAVEYILCYSKTINNTKFRGLTKTSASNNGLMNQTNSMHELDFPANIVDTKLKNGIYKKGVYGTSSYHIELLEDTEVKDGYFIKPVKLLGKFKWGQSNLENEIRKGTVVSIKTKAFSPSYEKKEYEPEVPWNLINKSFGVDTNEMAGENLKKIIGKGKFDFPKPVSLIKYLIGFIKAETILDFFAGSGTTLDATMKLNAEDGGHRQCILVTNNENGICENVTYVRNKKVIEGYTTPKGDDVEGLHGNNLRYYKTDFVPRVRTVKNMRNLVNAATDMLCIKENMYKEKKQFGPWKRLQKAFARHFVDGEGGEMIIIYDETRIDEIVNAIRGMEFNKPLKVYVFSQDRDPYEDEFNDVLDKVELCALPAAIYDAYVQVLPKPQDEKVEIAENSGDEDFDSFDEEMDMDLAAEEEQR